MASLIPPPPDWLLDGAKDNGVAMGFLGSGWVAGFEAGQHSGACGREHPNGLRCALHDGHRGAHSTVAPFVWSTDPTPADLLEAIAEYWDSEGGTVDGLRLRRAADALASNLTEGSTTP